MSFPGSLPYTNPLNLNLQQPVGIIKATRDPTSQDTGYTPGVTEWQNTSSGTCFKLISTGVNGATWDTIAGPGSGSISTLTGNSGGAVTGDLSGNLNILGQSGQVVVTGSPGTNTLTISLAGGGEAIDSFQPDGGTNPVVPNASGLVIMSGSGSIQSVGGTNQLTYQLTGLTNHAVLVGAGTSTITNLAVGTTGQLLVGATGADPAFGSSAAADFSFTNATAATARTLTVSNSDNTSTSSHSILSLSTGGTSGGDPFVRFAAGSNFYSVGIDTPTSGQPFKISYSTTSNTPSSGTTLFTIDQSTSSTTSLNTNFYVQNTVTSGGPQCIVRNLSNNANASARMVIASSGTNDLYTLLNSPNGAGASWEYGLKGTTGDFEIQSGPANSSPTGAMDGTATVRVDQSGNTSILVGKFTVTNQPAFQAYVNTTVNNVTGDGTSYTVIFNTEQYDVGNNYNNATGVFTAPIAGRYLFFTTVLQSSLGAGHNLSTTSFSKSGNVLQFGDINSGVVRTANAGESNTYAMSATVVYNLAAADTVSVVTYAGGSTKTVGVFGASSSTYFGGILLN